MAFQIKDFASIVASMINLMRGNTNKITDFQPGSVARTLVEAPAVEIEELYMKMFQGLLEAIPVATYLSFGFDLLPSSAATGVLTFYALGGHSSTVVIPAGTTGRNLETGLDYTTTRSVTIPVGQTQVSVSAACKTAGFASNTDANTITSVVGNLDGVTGVANLTAFTGGRDVESEDERKVRFRNYISTLQRGTTAALYYGANSVKLFDVNGAVIEEAKWIKIVEPYEIDPTANNPGFVFIYIHNGVGDTSSALIGQVQKTLDGYYLDDGTPVPGYKAAGVVVQVVAAAETLVNVTGAVVVDAGRESDQTSILADCVTAVREYLLGLGIGSPAIKSEIIQRIMSVDGVYNVTLSAPSGDVAASSSTKLMPGVVSLAAP